LYRDDSRARETMSKPAFKVAACTAQHIGDRKEQQDRVGIFTSRRLPGGALFVVADGMGGKTGGAMAAQQVMTTAKNLFEEYSVGEPIQELLTQIVTEAHTVIKLSAISSEKEPHSTMVALVLQPDRADWAYVGDSRMYHFSGLDLIQRTIDHSYVEQLVAEGKIAPDEAHSHRLSNLLTSALGTVKPPQISFGSTTSLAPGQNFLLCSDGLWHYFNEFELADIIDCQGARQASEQLIEIARERAGGTGDNCTLVVIKLENPPPPPKPDFLRR